MRTTQSMRRVWVLGVAAVLVGAAALAGAADSEAEDTYRKQTYGKLAALKTFGVNDYTVVVLHIATEATGSNTEVTTGTEEAVYFSQVDAFTELRANTTQALIDVAGVTVRVWLEFPSTGVCSETRVLLANNATHRRIVGSRAITFVMEAGNVTDMYWDDSCVGCTAGMCLEHSCSTDLAGLTPSCRDATALREDPFRCGVKIYIGWKGTDSRGKRLSSYSSLPSRFQKFSFITSAYNAAAGFATDFISFWKKPLN